MDTPISPGELERIYGAAYQGAGVQVLLCTNPGALGPSSTTAEWAAAEVSGNGYVRFSLASLGAGSWNGSLLQYESPEFTATFTASGAGYSYDTLVIVAAGHTHPYTVVALGTQTLAAGIERSYPITIVQKSAV